MSSKMQKCKACGNEIASSAKQCPQCGAKNAKPIFKKWWFWLIVVVVIAIIAGNSNSGNQELKNAGNEKTAEEQQTIEYASYDVTELFDALKDNALKAQNTYKGQYVELTGYLGTIDSNGKYIGLEANPDDWDYLLQNVHCTLKKGSGQLEQIMELKKGEKITVRGKISDVGEVLGYYLDVDSIN